MPNDPLVAAIEPAPATAEAIGASALRFIGVTKRFGAVVAVNDVALDILAGEIHGIVGENGAGKSTLVGMATASQAPSAGEVEILGSRLDGANPRQSQALGLAGVRQHPALFPDMTVAENVWLKAPASLRPSRSKMHPWAQNVLDDGIAPGLVDLRALCSDITVEARYTVELAIALMQQPKVFMLDEPTEHLGSDLVAKLFERLRELRGRGCAVVYISHRLRDVQSLSDRISVMRDGRLRGTFGVHDLSTDQLVAQIAGRPVNAIFPSKSAVSEADQTTVLEVDHLRGAGFDSTDLSLARGEVVGLAGIEGNGQREFLRALACLVPSTGRYLLEGKTIRRSRREANRLGIAYVPRDRREEGLFRTLSVGENLQADSSPEVAAGGVIRPAAEQRATADIIRRFGIRTPSAKTPVDALSGGNAQKTVLARSLNRDPKVLLLDEPTQGVDVGAREEIYRMIRSSVDRGAAVVIAGSDAAELEGLCDRVLVFARGSIVAELRDGEVTEYNIVSSAVTADAGYREHEANPRRTRFSFGYSRTLMLLVLNVLLAVAVTIAHPRYLSELNVEFMLAALTTLGFVAMAQQAMLLIGGIDLSVGGVAGLTVVGASYLLVGINLAANLAIFLGLLVAMVIVLALLNWFLGDVIGLTPFIGTLATFVALQAVLLTLRPAPGGIIDTDLTALVATTIGPVPVMLIVCIVVGILLQLALTRTVWGASLRAVGGAQEVADAVGMRSSRLRLSAYVLAAALAAVAGIMLMTQVGIGINTAGLNYTFSSMTAAIIGGAVLSGGRGSFLGALLGAALLQQALSATTFLGLSDYLQFYFVGGLIIVAAVVNTGRARLVEIYRGVRSAMSPGVKGGVA